MAKISNTAGSSNIWLGSNQNSRQTILYVPASNVAGGGTADKPGLLFLEAVDSSGDMQDGLYLWADSGSGLRYSATYPTDEDGDGTLVGTAAGATTTLNNIASVSIPNAGGLFAANDNQVDIGKTGTEFKDAWFDGVVTTDDLEADVAQIGRVQGSGSNYIGIAASGVMTTEGTATINGITLTNNANEIKMTKGTASFEIAAGDTDLIIGAAGSLDVAAAIDVDINGNLTIGATAALTTSGASAVTLDQDLQASASVTFGDVTTSGIINTTTVADFTVSGSNPAISIGANNNRLSFGANDDSDSYIYYDGTSLKFWDDDTALAYTLKQLATGTTLNPVVNGNLTISDGDFDWTNTSTSESATWDLGATSVDAIDIIADTTDAKSIHLIANSTTSGSLLYLQAVDATMTSGEYIDCYDGTNEVFTVKRYGATVVRGSDGGTAVLTATKGDVVLSDGRITQTADSDIGNTLARSVAGSSNLLGLALTDTTATGAALYIDNQTQGAGTAINVLHDGTGAILALASSGTARAGEGITLSMTNFEAQNGISVSGAYTGAAGKGALLIDIGIGVLAADSSLVRLEGSGSHAQHSHMQEIIYDTGQLVGATDGYMLKITDASTAQGTSYAVNIDAGTNEALHVDAGLSLFDEKVTVAGGGIDITGVSALAHATMTVADNAGVDALTIDQNDVTQDKDGLVITQAGDGYGIKLTTETATGKGVLISAAASQSVSLVSIDGRTADWIGNADDVGMVHITHGSTALAHVGSTVLYVGSDAIQKASAQGSLARFEVTAASAQANAVAVEIIAKDKTEYALNLGAGQMKMADWIVAGGIHYNVQDVTATDAGLQLTDKYGFYTVDQTTGDDGDILILPPGLQGMTMWIYNDDATDAFVVTPYGAETINGGGGGVGLSLIQLTTARLICVADGLWLMSEFAANGDMTTGA